MKGATPVSLDLARWQFASTSIYHFLFVPITIGLAFLVALLETAWYRNSDDTYRRLARFFGLVERPNRRSNHQAQVDQAADVWPRQTRLTRSTADWRRMTLNISETASEPVFDADGGQIWMLFDSPRD